MKKLKNLIANNTLYKEAESQFLSVLKEHLDKNYEKWKKDSKQAEGQEVLVFTYRAGPTALIRILDAHPSLI